MGRPISYKTDEQVVSKWYAGEPRGTITNQTGTSAGHISDVVNQEYELVGEGNVKALRRIVVALGKADYGLPELMKAIRFNNACRLQSKLDVDDIVETLPKVVELCAANNLRLEELPQRIERNVAQVKESESEREVLAKDVQQLENQRKHALEEAKTTEEELEKFRSAEEMLKKRGLTFDDLERLEHALANAEAAKYDVNELVKTMSTNKSLVDQNKELAAKNASLAPGVQKNIETIKQQEIVLQQNSELIRKMHELGAMGFGLPQLQSLCQVTTTVSAAHGLMTGPKAVEKLVADLKRDYDGHVGLQLSISQIKQDIEHSRIILQREQARTAGIGAAVDAVLWLFSQGIGQDGIVAINNLVKGNGLAFEEILVAITRCGSLKDVVAQLEQKKKDMDEQLLISTTKAEELDRENAVHKGRLQALDASINGKFLPALESLLLELTKGVQKIDTSLTRTSGKIDDMGNRAQYNADLFERNSAIHTIGAIARVRAGALVPDSDVRTAIILCLQIASSKLQMSPTTKESVREAIYSLNSDSSFDIS